MQMLVRDIVYLLCAYGVTCEAWMLVVQWVLLVRV